MSGRAISALLSMSIVIGACSENVEPIGATLKSSECPTDGSPILLPTGAWITPLAAPGANLLSLNPGLPTRPDFTAGQAVSTALSPDGTRLLILTSGYNRNYGSDG